ncbi:cytochrome P450 [Nocardia sp. AB354]|uniref:cytochrome P450 n=1 Tax=Nocardia sp. AB354 TaxID=3413283 RepID=UPI003C19CFC0
MTTSPSTTGTDFEKLVALEERQVRCPFGAYNQLREKAPVAWDERLRAWVLTRHADIKAVAGDSETFSSRSASGNSSVTALAHRVIEDDSYSETTKAQARRRLDLSASPALLNCDPPHHKRQRRLVQSAFARGRVLEMEDDIARLTHKLIDNWIDRGEVDFIREFTLPLPMTVIAKILGVPPSRMAEFKEWSDAFTKGVGSLELPTSQIVQLFQSVDDFYSYFTEQLELRRSHPCDDLLTGLVEARFEDDQPLTTDECLQMLVVFLVGGNETTTNLLGSSILRLVVAPDLRASVTADRGLIPALIEEVLRLHSPIQGLFRTATRDVTVGGQSVSAGENLYLAWGAGNHDADRFPDPDNVDLNRGRATGHLAFGHGEHTCLGANLARSETRIALNVLLDRLTDFEIGGVADHPRHPSFVLHGPAAITLRFRKVEARGPVSSTSAVSEKPAASSR